MKISNHFYHCDISWLTDVFCVNYNMCYMKKYRNNISYYCNNCLHADLNNDYQMMTNMRNEAWCKGKMEIFLSEQLISLFFFMIVTSAMRFSFFSSNLIKSTEMALKLFVNHALLVLVYLMYVTIIKQHVTCNKANLRNWISQFEN